jgi:hypothetical protein
MKCPGSDAPRNRRLKFLLKRCMKAKQISAVNQSNMSVFDSIVPLAVDNSNCPATAQPILYLKLQGMKVANGAMTSETSRECSPAEGKLDMKQFRTSWTDSPIQALNRETTFRSLPFNASEDNTFLLR